ncbi:MAG: hypothetical protein ACR2QC_04420 [Gammaproteobacteria bacterium]
MIGEPMIFMACVFVTVLAIANESYRNGKQDGKKEMLDELQTALRHGDVADSADEITAWLENFAEELLRFAQAIAVEVAKKHPNQKVS